MCELSEQQRSDFKWYVGEMPDLYQQYGECHVVISGKKVIGAFHDFGSAVRYAQSNLESGSFIVQKVGKSSDAYTAYIPSLVVRS